MIIHTQTLTNFYLIGIGWSVKKIARDFPVYSNHIINHTPDLQ